MNLINKLGNRIKLKLRDKLLLSVVFIIFLFVGSIGYMALKDAETSLKKSIFNHLTTIRSSRAYEIESYLSSVSRELKILSASNLSIEASKAFISSENDINKNESDPSVILDLENFYTEEWTPRLNKALDKELTPNGFYPKTTLARNLQYEYIVKNKFKEGERYLLDTGILNNSYDKQHLIYHPKFRDFIKKYGFYDLFIINPADGQIVYSVMKESDFGTNLFIGAHKDSNLADVVKNCLTKESEGICYGDFAKYNPSFGAPASFIATPVYENGKLLSILALQINSKNIDNIMTSDRKWEESGLGKTGEVYLVGSDYTLRSNSRFFIEDRENYFNQLRDLKVSKKDISDMDRNNCSLLIQRVETTASKGALKGENKTQVINDYRNIPVLSSYQKILFEGTTYAVIAEQDLSEAFKPIYDLRKKVLLLSSISFLFVLLLGTYLINRYLTYPIKKLMDGANQMIRGNYSVQLEINQRDELGDLTIIFNDMCLEVMKKNKLIEIANQENEKLLLNILPIPIASRLKKGEKNIADNFEDVTVLFADIVGFTELSTRLTADKVIKMLNNLFLQFDSAAYDNGVEKIKTIGDSYMAVSGMLEKHKDHQARMIHTAIKMINITREFSFKNNLKIELRIGINSGNVVAGIVGENKFLYDVWGDTVNMASRMESEGIVGVIQVTEDVYNKTKDIFPFEPREPINIPGKGIHKTWALKI